MAPPSTDSTLARQLGVILGSSSLTLTSILSAIPINLLSLKHQDFSLLISRATTYSPASCTGMTSKASSLTGSTTCLLQSTLPNAARVTVLLKRLMLTRLSIRSRCHHGPQGPVRSGHCWLSINCSFPSLHCGHPAFVSDKHLTPSCLQDLHTSCFLCLEHHPHPWSISSASPLLRVLLI